MTNSVNTVIGKQSLEAEFEDLVFCNMDVDQQIDFPDFLNPNEFFPENIVPHLKGATRGIFISTGTVRSDFLDVLSDHDVCEGLVSLDINPRVKAWRDFNTLLLKISKNMRDYAGLSIEIEPGSTQDERIKTQNHAISVSPYGSTPNPTNSVEEYVEPQILEFDALALGSTEEFKSRIELIRENLNLSNLSQKEKSYYSKYLEPFAKVYFSAGNWRSILMRKFFSAVSYYKNAEQFLKLQKHAISGNLISIIGNINDLKFLKNRTVSVVDTSNIADYCLINLQGIGNFSPKIIWTNGLGRTTCYHSVLYSEILSDEEKRKFDNLIEVLKQSRTLAKCSGTPLARELNNFLSSPFFDKPGDCFHYTKGSLLQLEEYAAENIIQDNDGPKPIDVNDGFTFGMLKPKQIATLVNNPKTLDNLDEIFAHWAYLTPEQYLEFCKSEGWQASFKQCFKQQHYELPGFLEKLRKSNLEEAFKERFGREEFEIFERDLSY